MESKNEIAVVKIQSENDTKGEEHGGESWENFEDEFVEIDLVNPANQLLFPERHGDPSTEGHAGHDFNSASQEELILEHNGKVETDLTEDDNIIKAIKAFERYSNCSEIQGVEQNRISEIVSTLMEMKMSQMDRVESSAIPTGFAMDEAASTTKETVFFKNISIKERSIFKSSEIEEESSDFSDESSSLLISPARKIDHQYWGANEGLSDVSSSSHTSAVTTKAAIKLTRAACDQYYSDLKNFYEPLSPEFYVNIEAAKKQSWFSAKEIKKYIVAKVKRFGKIKKDPMNMILDADELRRKLEEHLENEKTKDKLMQKEKSKWKPLTGCCEQDGVVASHKRKTSKSDNACFRENGMSKMTTACNT